MESVDEQDDIHSHKNEKENLYQNYRINNPNDYFSTNYATLPYENINNQNAIQAIQNVFRIKFPNNIQENTLINQQASKQDQNIPDNNNNNCINQKENENSEFNEILNNNYSNKENNIENNIENNDSNVNKFQTGRWSPIEHQKFIEGILKYGNEWKNVQNVIKTRSSTQARSHAQKYFLRLRKIIRQDILKNPNGTIEYIINKEFGKNENNFTLTAEQKEKLMSVIKSNLRAEENVNKSDKDIFKNDCGLEELNEEEEDDNLGYNKFSENEVLGLQKKMSCEIDTSKKRKITFCSRKRKSSNDMTFNNKDPKIFDIKKDINNKRSIDITNENHFILNISQPKVDIVNNGNNNENKMKKKNSINNNPNFIVNKNNSNNSNQDILNNTQINANFNNNNIQNQIIIQNNYYNYFYLNHKNEIDENVNNNRNNSNYIFFSNNKLNNFQNENVKTVIFKTDFKPKNKPQKSNSSQNQINNSNQNEFNQINANYIMYNKNFFPNDEINNGNINQENINNNSSSINMNNENNNNGNSNIINNNNYYIYKNNNNENTQIDPFCITFENISSNDKKIDEYYNNNNNFENIEKSQTLTDNGKNLSFFCKE